jgi:hypothetical protein
VQFVPTARKGFTSFSRKTVIGNILKIKPTALFSRTSYRNQSLKGYTFFSILCSLFAVSQLLNSCPLVLFYIVAKHQIDVVFAKSNANSNTYRKGMLLQVF